MIISFAWTTDALLAGAKTCARRGWSLEHVRKFRPGQLSQAYDRSPRVGGKQIAIIRHTRHPYLQPTSQMTEADYIAEGFAWMEENGLMVPVKDKGRTLMLHPRRFFEIWKLSGAAPYVVRFELVEVITPVAK